MGLKPINFEINTLPKELVLSLAKEFNVSAFVETGTYRGETTTWAVSYFKNIYTIEASYDLYNQASTKFSKTTNVECIFGDSSEHIQSCIHQNSIYYLDAHYSGDETYNGNPPLLHELEVINSFEYEDYIIIDDARYILSGWMGERYCTLQDIIQSLSKKNRYIVCIEDRIIAVPQDAKSILDEYVNKVSKELWDCFVKGHEPVRQNSFLKKLKSRLRFLTHKN